MKKHGTSEFCGAPLFYKKEKKDLVTLKASYKTQWKGVCSIEQDGSSVTMTFFTVSWLHSQSFEKKELQMTDFKYFSEKYLINSLLLK